MSFGTTGKVAGAPFLAGALAVGLLLLSACDGGTEPTQVDHWQRAQQFVAKEKWKATIIELRSLLKQQPDNGEARLMLGGVLLEQGDELAAIKELQRAASLGEAAIHTAPPLARALFSQRQFQAVLDDIDPQSLPPGSRHWVALMIVRGNAQRALGDDAAARRSFDAALDAAPGEVGALLGLARLAMDKGRLDNAQSLLDAAVKIAPGNYRVWYALGRLRLAQRRFESALAAYRSSLAGAPDPGPAQLGMAWAYLALGNTEQVREYAGLALEDRPKHASANYLMAAAAFADDEFAEADKFLQRTLKVAPDDPSVLLLAALNAHASGNNAQAEAALQRFVDTKPDYIPAQTLLAQVLVLQGNAGRAYQQLAELSQRAGIEHQLALQLARLAIQGGVPAEAKLHLQRLLNAGSRDPALKAAQRKLKQGFARRALEELDRAGGSSGRTGEETAQLAAELRRIGGLMRDKRYDDALFEARRLARGGSAEARNLLAIAEAASGDIEAARRSFEQSMALDPRHTAELTLNLVALDVSGGAIGTAAKRLDGALQELPNHTGLLLARARIAAMDGDVAQAQARLERVLEIDPASLPARLVLTQLLMATEDFAQAEEIIAPARRLQPQEPRALSLDAALAAQRGDYELAEDMFRQLTITNAKPASAYLALTAIHLRRGRPDKAIARLRELIALHPTHLEAHQELVRLLYLTGEFAVAYEVARDVQSMPGLADAGQILEGDIDFAEGNPGIAADRYQSVYPRVRTLSLARSLHRALWATGRHDDAIVVLQGWVENHPQDIKGRHLLALAYRRNGQEVDAIAQLRAVLAINPDDLLALNNLAAFYSGAGDRTLALHFAGRAYDKYPGNPAVADTWGWLLVEAGRSGEALEPLRRAAKRLADNSEVNYHLAQALADSGDVQGALQHLRIALAKNFDFEGAEQARALRRKLAPAGSLAN